MLKTPLLQNSPHERLSKKSLDSITVYRIVFIYCVSHSSNLENQMGDSRSNKLRLELRRGVLVMSVLASSKTPQYGYSLRKLLNDAGIEIDEGTLYPLIRRLAEQELLNSEWKNSDGRERRYYSLSDKGEEVLTQLTQDWQQLNKSVSALLSSV
jgi:DNA-binding PadR family transcriptional regulator